VPGEGGAERAPIVPYYNNRLCPATSTSELSKLSCPMSKTKSPTTHHGK